MNMKKTLSLVLALTLPLVMFACTSSDKEPADSVKPGKAESSDSTKSNDPVQNDSDQVDVLDNSELAGRVSFVGPGLFSDVGPDGVEDLVTGQTKPGYNELVEKFNKTYPNIELQIDAVPWDNWMSVVQTAASGGTADILLHGSMLAEVCMDLTPYLDKDPEVYEALAIKPEVFRPDEENYNRTAPTGISYLVAPYYALLDTKLFEDWGVDIPNSNWTYAELLELAKSMTGVNPVTGEQNYGVWYFGNEDGNIWKLFSTVSAAWGFKSMVFDTPNKYDAKMNFDSPEAVKVFEYINNLYKYTPPSIMYL